MELSNMVNVVPSVIDVQAFARIWFILPLLLALPWFAFFVGVILNFVAVCTKDKEQQAKRYKIASRIFTITYLVRLLEVGLALTGIFRGSSITTMGN